MSVVVIVIVLIVATLLIVRIFAATERPSKGLRREHGARSTHCECTRLRIPGQLLTACADHACGHSSNNPKLLLLLLLPRLLNARAGAGVGLGGGQYQRGHQTRDGEHCWRSGRGCGAGREFEVGPREEGTKELAGVASQPSAAGAAQAG
jgi:hypothetical protein